jgi:Flp pilus assembly protein TadB
MRGFGIGIECLVAGMAGMAIAAVVLAIRSWGPLRAPRGGSVRFSSRLPGWLRRMPVPETVARLLDRPDLGDGLRRAALPLDRQQFIAAQWLAMLGAGAGVALVVCLRPLDPLSGLGCVLLLFAGVAGPKVWLNSRVQQRQQEITLALPDLLDRLAFGLQAGLAFDVVLRRVSPSIPGPLGDELRRAIQGLDLGWRRDQAMRDLAHGSGSQEVRNFVAAVHQAEVLGTPLAEALRVQNELLRAARRRRAQEASRRLPIIILFPLVFFFLPALLIVYLAPPVLHFFLLR